MLTTLFYCAIAVFVVYIVAVLAKFGIPKSVSDTYYLWTGTITDQTSEFVKGIKKSVFTIFLYLVGFLAVPLWIEITPNVNYQFLAFVGAAALAFVGAACMFKQGLTKQVHYASAGIWAACSIAWAVLVGQWVWVPVALVAAIFAWLLNKRKNITFWLEIGCVLLMVGSIFCTIPKEQRSIKIQKDVEVVDTVLIADTITKQIIDTVTVEEVDTPKARIPASKVHLTE